MEKKVLAAVVTGNCAISNWARDVCNFFELDRGIKNFTHRALPTKIRTKQNFIHRTNAEQKYRIDVSEKCACASQRVAQCVAGSVMQHQSRVRY